MFLICIFASIGKSFYLFQNSSSHHYSKVTASFYLSVSLSSFFSSLFLFCFFLGFVCQNQPGLNACPAVVRLKPVHWRFNHHHLIAGHRTPNEFMLLKLKAATSLDHQQACLTHWWCRSYCPFGHDCWLSTAWSCSKANLCCFIWLVLGLRCIFWMQGSILLLRNLGLFFLLKHYYTSSRLPLAFPFSISLVILWLPGALVETLLYV